VGPGGVSSLADVGSLTVLRRHAESSRQPPSGGTVRSSGVVAISTPRHCSFLSHTESPPLSPLHPSSTYV
jgi:hypothetical protein